MDWIFKEMISDHWLDCLDVGIPTTLPARPLEPAASRGGSSWVCVLLVAVPSSAAECSRSTVAPPPVDHLKGLVLPACFLALVSPSFHTCLFSRKTILQNLQQQISFWWGVAAAAIVWKSASCHMITNFLRHKVNTGCIPVLKSTCQEDTQGKTAAWGPFEAS